MYSKVYRQTFHLREAQQIDGLFVEGMWHNVVCSMIFLNITVQILRSACGAVGLGSILFSSQRCWTLDTPLRGKSSHFGGSTTSKCSEDQDVVMGT